MNVSLRTIAMYSQTTPKVDVMIYIFKANGMIEGTQVRS